ncbi:MAG: alpha/beta hydrolase [Gammaproteobacteria bacterium]|nr:alpha/beta hydrolase [Gammaproteobacteria bacterium]
MIKTTIAHGGRDIFLARDGTLLAVYDWPVAGAPLTALIVHGLGEHAGRYELLARWLNSKGVAVRAYDQFGHGHSEGPRGGLLREGQLPEHLSELAAATRTEQSFVGRPFVLIGHSLGGLVVASAIRRGLVAPKLTVLSSPALAVRMASWQRAAVKILPRLAPTLTLGNGLDPTKLSHDAQVVADYLSDPLVHDRICALLGAFIATEGEAIRASAPTWQTPTCLLYAGDDRAVDPAGSREFAAAAPSGIVKAQCFPAMYHEIFNEPDRALVLSGLEKALAAVA